MSSLNRSNKGYVKRKKSMKNWGWRSFKIDTGLESFAFFIRSWKMKILNIYSAWFLPRSLYSTRNIPNILLVNTKYNFFKNSFFPSTIIEWNNLDPHLTKSDNFLIFKSNTLRFIRPSPNSVYNCHSPIGICLITRLKLGLSHLREHNLNMVFKIL